MQKINNDFLEWFIKNPSCNEVKIDYLYEPCLNCEWNYDECQNAKECLKGKYKIVIPKEESKQIIQEYEQQGLEKYSYELNNVPIQESIEEVSLRLYPIILDDDWDKNKQYRDEWINGVNWQEKRMYKENDMLDFAWFMFENLGEWTDDREAHFKGMYLEKWKIFKNNQLFNEYKIGIDK